jgi:signal transduction histidine kinase
MENYLKTATILYVEDDKDILDGYSRAINRYAKELYLASNGLEALEIYKEKNIDIIITDIRMPKMDGLAMLEEIDKLNPNQKVIITSAYSDSESFLKAISLHVDGYILKPVDKYLLKEKIIKFSREIALEKEMKIKNKQLLQKEKLASMGEMITNIAHHWRQPLSLISTVAGGLQVEKELGVLSDEKFTKGLDQIISKVEELSKTIDDFRLFMGNEDNIFLFNIFNTINKVLNIQKQAISNEELNIVLNIDKSLQINNYENSFIQSLVAIITNAMEAFDTQDDMDKYLFIDLFKKGEDIKLILKDNAGGIDEEMLPKLFEAYTTTKHQYVGTGLGLYTTYGIITQKMGSIIEAYNEEYEYNSKKYKGAKFIITLKNHG